jgi:hypothetical protein
MLLRLHRVLIHLQSDNELIKSCWQQLFAGWPSLDDTYGHKRPADVCLRLTLTNTLPILPDDPPFFTNDDMRSEGVGLLSVYDRSGDDVLLHFLDGALVTVPLYLEKPSSIPTITGFITEAAIDHGRFEDITFTSLAPLLRRQDYYLVHAFAASKDGQAVLIVGPTNSGKTTTGLSLLMGGWKLLSNDILLLEQRPEGVYALPTPGGFSIRPFSLTLLPALEAIINDTPLIQGRYNLTNQQLAGDIWSESARVSIIYFPQIEDEISTGWQPVSRGICLALLMEESIDHWDRAMFSTHVDMLKNLCQQTTPYTLHLGQDIKQLPQLLDTINLWNR